MNSSDKAVSEETKAQLAKLLSEIPDDVAYASIHLPDERGQTPTVTCYNMEDGHLVPVTPQGE